MEAEKLPKQCKDVFFLSFKSGFTGKEISKLLNITASTVFNQRARAIAFLKKKLNPY
jgi:RNA polymerase sigma factor (sigma-70 family)